MERKVKTSYEEADLIFSLYERMDENPSFKRLCKLLLQAQVASNSGKGDGSLFCHYRRNSSKSRIPEYLWNAGRERYWGKPQYVKNAIELINRCNFKDVNYYVEAAPDQNGYGSILVYFDILVEKERLQMSFHNPSSSDRATNLLGKYVGKGRQTRWSRGDRKGRVSAEKVYNGKADSDTVANYLLSALIISEEIKKSSSK